MEKYLCNCGHTVIVDDIHAIESYDGSRLYDICDKCWHEDFDLIDTEEVGNMNLAKWKFATKEDQDKVIISQHIVEG